MGFMSRFVLGRKPVGKQMMPAGDKKVMGGMMAARKPGGVGSLTGGAKQAVGRMMGRFGRR